MISLKREDVLHVLLAFAKLAIIARPVAQGYQDICKDTRQHGVDAGLVRVPDFQDNVPNNVTCSWSFTAPPGKKLLVKVDSVHYPPQDVRDTTLKLFLDEEIIDIPRNCVKCLKQLVSGHSIRISYSSSLLSEELVNQDLRENALYNDAGSFQIRYKAFDPSVCDRPRTPPNGEAIVGSRKLGQDVKYRCNPPYDLFGKSSAVCQIPVDSPVPEWSNGPPKCGISNCSNVPIRRRADSVNSGAIASPGYPNFKIHSTFNCEWIITAEKGYQIISFLSFLDLADQKETVASLKLYDGPRRTPISSDLMLHRNITTKSNVLTVTFKTNNTVMTEGGFFLNYNAVPASCPDPVIPENGEVVGYSFLVGSTIAYRCETGYTLEGVNQAECLMNGRWSGILPVCVLTPIQVPTPNNTLDNHFSSTLTLPVTDLLMPTTELSVAPDTTTFVTPTESALVTKITKSFKKAKLISTEKIIAKSSPKPKSVDDVNLSSDDRTVTPITEWATALAINDTREELKSSRTLENGISEKKENTKSKGDGNKESIAKVTSDHDETKGANDDGDEETAEEEPEGDLDDSTFDGLDPSPRAPPYSSTRPTEASSDNSRESNTEDISVLTTYVAIGVGVGVLLILISVITMLIVYRKRFPVRMRFGRKFSTFENPMYVANKEHDAQHPRELKRLTV